MEKRACRTDRKDAGSVQPDIMPCIPDPGLHHSCRYVIDGRCDREIHGGKRDDASLPDRLFQGLKGLKMASGIFSRTCRFFYFYRIECAVLMNEQIDLFGVFVAIVVNGGTLAVVPPAFDVLRYHPAFKNGS